MDPSSLFGEKRPQQTPAGMNIQIYFFLPGSRVHVHVHARCEWGHDSCRDTRRYGEVSTLSVRPLINAIVKE